MKKHIAYPKIQQFRNVVSTINREVSFVKLDENQEPIYDSSIKKPIITFKGTVKLHGTNASVCFNSTDGLWVQSRNNVITTDKDNAGFAFFVETRKVQFCRLIDNVRNKLQIDTTEFTISIYGEWAGKGIQKEVGISKLDKAFYIFGVKISKPGDIEFKSYWVDHEYLSSENDKIYNISSFETFELDIDFNNPKLVQNKLAEITTNVEKQCPVSKKLGIEDGIGEGVVWSGEHNGIIHRFKVKGDKHSVTKVKTLAKVDIEKLENISKFVKYSLTNTRFEQAIKEVFGDNDVTVTKLGDVIRWTLKDILSEELDTMTENNLEPKDINRELSLKIKELFFELLNKI